MPFIHVREEHFVSSMFTRVLKRLQLLLYKQTSLYGIPGHTLSIGI